MPRRLSRRQKQSWESPVQLMNEVKLKKQKQLVKNSSEPIETYQLHELADMNDSEPLPHCN